MIAIITGVEKGGGWVPGDGEPLNGEYELTQNPGFPCGWERIDLPFIAAFSIVVNWTIGEMWSNGPPFIKQFWGIMFVEPWFNVDNNQMNPGSKFFNGKLRVMW